jgi:hypothetical protein
MKKIILVLLAMALVMLVGCSSNMTKIHKHFDNYGQPVIEDEIQKGDQTIYYFFVNYGLGWGHWGWYCYEYVSDKDGNILKKREYYVGSPMNNSENEQSLETFRKRIHQ